MDKMRQKHATIKRTSFERLRLKDDDTRHRWVYLEDESALQAWPQSYADKYFLGLDLVYSLLFLRRALENLNS